MDQHPLVSVIVPVYNVEKYLRKCLDSITNQTYQNLEIILVDDGSKDSSGQICDYYASKDSRIKAIHKENGGVSSARNQGLAIATGKWILFVDADDTLPYDTLSYYADVVSSNEVDMVLGSYVECDEEGHITRFDLKQFEKQISMLDCLKLFYKSDTSLFQGYVWNRLMKHSIIQENNLRFNESIYFKEDGLFAVQYMVNCYLPCFYSSNIVYNYNIYDTSSMRLYRSNFGYKYLSNLDARLMCYNSIKEKFSDSNLLHQARNSVLLFYNEILYKSHYTSNNKLLLRLSLFYKVGTGIGWSFFIKYKLTFINDIINTKCKIYK